MKPIHRIPTPQSLGKRALPLLTLGVLLSTANLATATEHTANFEADLGGWTAIEDTSLYDWARHTGGTPSGNTGPSSAHEGEYYVYLETSYGNTPAKIAYLESPGFSGEQVTGITFHYHLYGAQMGGAGGGDLRRQCLENDLGGDRPATRELCRALDPTADRPFGANR